MGFTIGGMRERSGARSGARVGVRRRGRSSEGTAVAEFTGLWGWDVVPGARVAPGARDCSCGRADCPEPGAHPLAYAPEIPAGSTLDDVTRAWSDHPGAAVMLPVGRAFDVLEVPETAGRLAVVRLERMGLPVGPVTVTPERRAQFFVAPGAADELPSLLYRMGLDDRGPSGAEGARAARRPAGLRALGAGAYVTAPPSDRGGRGPVRWLRQPALDSAAGLPAARLLLGTLAYAAHRSPRT
ncbi:bifunctional DNA primase/polymerase [Streptomyces sp. NPDC047130]|uniref:bifunctional DNA primase/polymerase n=1 Tax=Streptomyces sp. NPDC047130 TaxID=3155261 RepID=UPI0033C8BF6C